MVLVSVDVAVRVDAIVERTVAVAVAVWKEVATSLMVIVSVTTTVAGGRVTVAVAVIVTGGTVTHTVDAVV